MISSLAISIFLIVLGAGIISTQIDTKVYEAKLESVTPSASDGIEDDSPSPAQLPTGGPSPTLGDVAIETEVDEDTNDTSGLVSEEWFYPNATLAMTQETVTMTTTDDPGKVTQWYKDKIDSLGMNTTSFVTTSANSNVKNVLSATSGTEEITLTITRNAGDEKTTIVI